MGYKNICINCKAVRNLDTDLTKLELVTNQCPICNIDLIRVDQKFKAPKKKDFKSWKVVEFLIQNGFQYHSIKTQQGETIKYPESMKEAKEFVKNYKTKHNNT